MFEVRHCMTVPAGVARFIEGYNDAFGKLTIGEFIKLVQAFRQATGCRLSDSKFGVEAMLDGNFVEDGGVALVVFLHKHPEFYNHARGG